MTQERPGYYNFKGGNMAFDPDQYLAEREGIPREAAPMAFDPDAYLAERAPEEPQAQPEPQAPAEPSPEALEEAAQVRTSPRMRRGAQARAVRQAEQEQFLSSLPPERRALLESISPAEAAMIGIGRGFTDVGRGVGLMDDPREGELEAFRQLEEASPEATIGQVVGQAAPFVPAGFGVAGIASTPARVAATGALGATEGGILARGQGADAGETLQAAGIGGSVASALELGLPVIGRVGSKIFRRVLGKTPKGALVDAAGRPTQEFVEALDKAGLSYDDVLDESIKQMKGQALDPDYAAREAFLRSQGLDPTRAQVTREAADFQAQQEAAKTSSRIRDALEQQEAVLTTRFNNQILETGGDIGQANTVSDALVSKASTLDNEVSRLYQEAREILPDEKNVRLSELSTKLKQLAPSDRRAGGNISAVVGDLQAKGVLDDNLKVIGKIDVETAEDVRMLMNELYDPKNPFGNMKLRELKETLDEDVFKAAGKDVYDQARSAKREFEKGLSRAKISKFDDRKQNLVRDILENKVDPDRLTEQVVFSKKWRPNDLEQLKDYITDTPEGLAAFNDLKADTLQEIKDMAFIGPQDAQGMRSLSADKLDKALKRVGPKKLQVLFNEDERKFLSDLVKVTRLREPVKGTALGQGPTAQAVNSLKRVLRGDGVLGNLVDAIDITGQNKAVLKALPKQKQPFTGSGVRTGAALGAIAPMAAAEEQEEAP